MTVRYLMRILSYATLYVRQNGVLSSLTNVDDTVLKRLDKRSSNVEASIYTKQISDILQIDINRHNAQYAHVDVRIATNAHDRFMIIDDNVFHIGASIKDLGKKIFAFSLMSETPDELLSRISRQLYEK